MMEHVHGRLSVAVVAFKSLARDSTPLPLERLDKIRMWIIDYNFAFAEARYDEITIFWSRKR